jgi:hypothetical protein
VNELERALLEVGRDLDVPESPDLVPAVLARLEPRSGRAAWQFGRRELAVALAVVLLAALAAVLAVPDARSALLRVLHLGGERIELVDELPTAGGGLDESALGTQVTLEEARSRAGFPLRELDDPPDRVYLLGDRPTVWFVYGPPGDVRLLVSQTPRLVVDHDLIAKKAAGPGTSIDETDVDGSPAFFLSGDPHLLLLFDDNGEVVSDSTRLAENVLIWQDDNRAFRLEGDFSLDEAVELGESLR